MSEHHLQNPRIVNRIPADTRDPICYQCRYPLADAKRLADIITGTGNRRFCNEQCYDEYIKARAAQSVIDHVNSDRYKPYVPTWQRQSQPTPEHLRPENTAPAFRPDLAGERAAASRARHDAKSNVRKTGEAAANVVGFVIWMCVVSAIAALLFAACGIQSL